MEIHFFYMKSLWSGMYVGTVLTFVGGGVRALSTLPGLNQHMSQVGHITALCLSLSLDHGHAHGFSHSFGHGFGHGLVVINQCMSQVDHIGSPIKQRIFLPGRPILLEPAGPGIDRDGEPSGRKPSHQGSLAKQL